MPILLGAFFVVLILLTIRIFSNSNPKVLLAIFKGILGALALIVILVLVLSGRFVNVVIGFAALIPLFLVFKKSFTKEDEPSLPPFSIDLSSMTRAQAQEILNVSENASPKEIKEAYRRIIKNLHPDHGGSDYLAAQVNRAKEILLNKM